MHLQSLESCEGVAGAILSRRKASGSASAILVAISGIDGAGKGYCAARIASSLEQRNLNVALIGLDGWLHLPATRFNTNNPAQHFYENAFRFEEMFETLVLPLRRNREIDVRTDYTEETATEYRKHRYRFRAIDIILLEGIFLLKKDFRCHFDLTCWVDCSFESALARAVKRCQEGLPPLETVCAFQTIYFPAQQIHFERDAPQAAADFILLNEEEADEASIRCPRPPRFSFPK